LYDDLFGGIRQSLYQVHNRLRMGAALVTTAGAAAALATQVSAADAKQLSEGPSPAVLEKARAHLRSVSGKVSSTTTFEKAGVIQVTTMCPDTRTPKMLVGHVEKRRGGATLAIEGLDYVARYTANPDEAFRVIRGGDRDPMHAACGSVL